MQQFPGITPAYIDTQMLYLDFCRLCDHVDDLEREAKRQRRAAARGR